MKLLYSLTSYLPAIGGAQLHHHQIATHLAARHQIQVVTQWDAHRTDWLLGTTLRAPESGKDYTFEGIPVHRIGLTWREKADLLAPVIFYYPLMDTAARSIGRVLEQHLAPWADGASLVHNTRIGREPMTYASLRLARHRNIPFVLTPVHHPRWRGWRYRVYLDLYRSADALLALTYAEKDLLVGLGVDDRKIHVVGIGPVLADRADPEGFRQRHGISGPVVLFLGQHFSYKGYRHILEAARSVWRKVPEACFLFVGPAVGRSEAVFASFADPRVKRLGVLSLQEKTDALAACQVLCVPSTQESFGGVYLEAWSYGKPVIGCPIPAVSEVVTHGRDGLLVRQDAESISEALCDLLLNPSLASQMGSAGREKVAAKFNWEHTARAAEQAYQSVLAGRSSS
jgi:glycosyltransferase involved in cell wall biosynthesis